MDRTNLYATLDKLFDGMEDLKDKAGEGLKDIKEKAEERFNLSDEQKEQIKLGADCAKDEIQRAACRSKGWLNAKMTQVQIESEGLQEKLELAKAGLDRSASLRYTEAMEKYAEDMLEIAQEATDEASDAVIEAVKARKEFKEKFGVGTIPSFV